MKTQILKYLKTSNSFVSGEEISRALKMSRTAVWKHIKQLRSDGFSIEAVSRHGYRLMSEPDKLFPDAVKEDLGTKIFGEKIVYFNSVDSTMNVASKMALEGAEEGVVVCAETQTKGRGRLGRDWVSPKGQGIYFSTIFRPRMALAEASSLTLVFAVAVCQAIRTATGLKAMIKWPNDILLEQKKVAGILTELNAETDRINFIVLGVGINVHGALPSFLKDAACLEKTSPQMISRTALFQEILRQIEEYYVLFTKKGFGPIAETWRDLSATLGTKVKIVELNKTTEGKAVDIDEHGALLIKERNGNIVRKISGDVIHLR